MPNLGDLLLAYAESAYNKALSKPILMSTFKLVYEVQPLSPVDRVSRNMDERSSVEASKRVQEIKTLHKQVKMKIEKYNASYKPQANRHKKKVVF